MRTAATLALTRPTSGFWAPLQVDELKEQLSDLSAALICAFNQLLDLKDLNTGVHSTRLAEWAVRVAQELGIEEKSLHDIEVAALLHDIGKVGVPDAILRKPGRLTEEEYALIKKHPEYGWAVLRHLPGLEHTSHFVLHHHESFDGKGYPAGLKEAEIPRTWGWGDHRVDDRGPGFCAAGGQGRGQARQQGGADGDGGGEAEVFAGIHEPAGQGGGVPSVAAGAVGADSGD